MSVRAGAEQVELNTRVDHRDPAITAILSTSVLVGANLK
jgi:hypothetical protein